MTACRRCVCTCGEVASKPAQNVDHVEQLSRALCYEKVRNPAFGSRGPGVRTVILPGKVFVSQSLHPFSWAPELFSTRPRGLRTACLMPQVTPAVPARPVPRWRPISHSLQHIHQARPAQSTAAREENKGYGSKSKNQRSNRLITSFFKNLHLKIHLLPAQQS